MFHILVVDDDKHTRKLLRAVLENAHYTVTTATNGEEALEALDKEHIDLVVLDIMMPKMDGLQAAKAIRAMQTERPDAEEIPIIALSANAFAEDVQTSLDAGMNGHISKPLNVAEVAKAIARNLNKS